ncbi:MAG: diguanylate cyclase, partial [Chloroflexi bacterium]|nr:diguanylate cyclase [Chloroflexota bacterium]
LEVNDAAAEVFGYDGVEDLRKIPVIDVYAIPDQRKDFTDAISARGFVKDMPVIFSRKNGQLMDCLLTAVAVRDKDGKVTGFQGTIKDITGIKQAQKALMEANERLQGWLLSAEQRNREIKLLGEMAQWIQSSQDMQAAYQGTAEYMSKLFEGDSGFIAEINMNDHIVEVKASFGKPEGKTVFLTSDCIALQKIKAHESDGSDASTICPHMGTLRGCYISIPLVTQNGASWLLQLQHGQGDLISSEACQQWLESRRPLVLSAGQELSVALSNIRLRETLHDQAIRDALTGLYNRRYMEEMLDLQLHRARRTGSYIGFIMADLDHFKIFNDSYGHAAGDLLLQAVANRIRNVIRVEDIACRYGGEEFLIILPYASLKDTHTRALQILEEIRDISFLYEGKQLGNMTISMGVSAFPENGDDASTLIRLADNAMYKAKNEGRDRVIIAG